MSDQRRAVVRRGPDRGPGRRDERLVLGHEVEEGRGTQGLDELDPARLPLAAPGRQQRREGRPLAFAPSATVGLEDADQNVEVADRPEPTTDLAQVASEPADGGRVVGVAEDPPGRPHPAAGHPHRVDLLRVDPLDRARRPGEHPGEVEAQDGATRLGPGIVGREVHGLGQAQPFHRAGRGNDGGRGRGPLRAIDPRLGDGWPAQDADPGRRPPTDRTGRSRWTGSGGCASSGPGSVGGAAASRGRSPSGIGIGSPDCRVIVIGDPSYTTGASGAVRLPFFDFVSAFVSSSTSIGSGAARPPSESARGAQRTMGPRRPVRAHRPNRRIDPGRSARAATTGRPGPTGTDRDRRDEGSAWR